ncbi:MAG: glycosyltransferase family 2 protein [Planctomycetaceae bacterium]
MLLAACGFCLFLVSVGLLQALLYVPFDGKMRRSLRTPAEIAEWQDWPSAAVVLSLRGADATLDACLRGLFQQDYPDCRILVVIDAETDPAWQVARKIKSELRATHVELLPLKNPLDTCSLKCSALVQAVSGLKSDCEILAFLDADVVPHRTWLKELVDPLARDAQVGATTGNRWFMPAELSWAAMTRSLWSAGALVQMCALSIPWGGSLATRLKLVRESGLLEKWAKSFNDDLLVGDMVQSQGLTLQFVPSLVMVNHESCDFSGLTQWLARQLIHVRFYHAGWTGVVTLGLLLSQAIPLGFAGGIVAAVNGDPAAASWCLGGCLGYLAIMYGLYLLIQRTVGRSLRYRPADYQWRFGLGRLAVAVLVSHIVYARALLTAMVRRHVAWRGITYHIRSSWNVRMLEYRPYVVDSATLTMPAPEPQVYRPAKAA